MAAHAASAASATHAGSIEVEHLTGDSFAIEVRGHRIVVDQPVDGGGRDLGPTPTELFVASLAGCVAFYASRYLRRNGLPVDGLAVAARFEMASERPARVSGIDLEVRLPGAIPERRLEALRRVIEHCTVHESIRTCPDVRTSIVEAPAIVSVA